MVSFRVICWCCHPGRKFVSRSRGYLALPRQFKCNSVVEKVSSCNTGVWTVNELDHNATFLGLMKTHCRPNYSMIGEQKLRGKSSQYHALEQLLAITRFEREPITRNLQLQYLVYLTAFSQIKLLLDNFSIGSLRNHDGLGDENVIS